MSDDQQLAETFAEVARALLAEPTLDSTLDKIVRTAVDTIAGCESAGITVVEKLTPKTRAASDQLAVQVDAIQNETNQGPCLDSIRDHEVFCTDDLTSEDRWPQFAPRAADETGVRSMLSLRLFVEEDTMGALNLFARRTDAFDEGAQVVGGVFAAHAAVAMSNAREVENLERAMEYRGVIEQAKGIVMAARGCSADEAFEILRQQSQALNEKLRDVAADIVRQQQRGS